MSAALMVCDRFPLLLLPLEWAPAAALTTRAAGGFGRQDAGGARCGDDPDDDGPDDDERGARAAGSCALPAAVAALMAAHPWLRPLYRRVLTALAAGLWLAFESWVAPGGLWFWLALGFTGYAIWDFFLSGNYREAPPG